MPFDPTPETSMNNQLEDQPGAILLIDPPEGATAEISGLGLSPVVVSRQTIMQSEALPADLHAIIAPLDLLPELAGRRGTGPARAVLLGFGAGAELECRLTAARHGADGFLALPFDRFELNALLDPRRRDSLMIRRRVLLIDDDMISLRLQAAWLSAAGFEVKTLSDPSETFAVLAGFHPDMLLLDLDMPACNGVDLATAIRQKPSMVTLPILFVSGERDAERQLKALDAGADGFLVKPLTRERLVGRVNATLRRLTVLERLVTRDGMTGLLNATALRGEIRRALSLGARRSERLSVALIDVDHFKQVNDRHGHAAGDRVLRRLADHLTRRVRSGDAVGRLGGEEFVIVFSHLDSEMGAGIVDQLRAEFAKLVQFHAADGQPVHCSFSCGIAEAGTRDTVDSVLERADQALYAAKHAGRNQVKRAEPHSTPPGA